MQAYTRILGGLRPLAQFAMADILEYLRPHLGPPEISRDFAQSLAGPQLTGQRRVMKIIKQHWPEGGRYYPSTPLGSSRAVTQQIAINLKIAVMTRISQHAIQNLPTPRISLLVLLEGLINKRQGLNQASTPSFESFTTVSVKHTR